MLDFKLRILMPGDGRIDRNM